MDINSQGFFHHVLGRGGCHSFTLKVPLWWRDLGQDEEGPSLVTSAWGMGEVVTRTVLRAISEFMIYHSLLQTQPLRSG